MGIGSSKKSNKSEYVKDLEKENDHLKTLLKRNDKTIYDQMYMIQLLNTKENAKMCLKNGVCHNFDKDSNELIIKSKEERDYDFLVFSGGGVKGVSYCGSVEALDELGILYDKDGNLKIKGFAGTSAGSIAASMLAIGCKPKEIKEFISNLDMDKVFDDKWGVIRDAINFIKDYGVAPGNYIYRILGDLIEKKTGDKDYTIEQLYKDTGISLVLVGTDINTQKSRYFYHNAEKECDRNIPIRKAIRISMSIPFMFEPVTYDNNLCVDGGVLDNYPLHVFDGDYPGDLKARLNLCVPNPKVLGINIMADNQVESYAVNNRVDINSPINFSLTFLYTFLAENERRIMTPSYWYRTINLITPYYPITDFTLSDEQKLELSTLGYKYVKDFFDPDVEDDMVDIDLN